MRLELLLVKFAIEIHLLLVLLLTLLCIGHVHLELLNKLLADLHLFNLLPTADLQIL